MKEISDSIVAQVLSDPRAREMIEDLMKTNHIEGAIEDLPEDTQKELVQSLLRAAQKSQPEAPTAEDIPEEMIHQVLEDAQVLANVNALLEERGIEDAFEDLDIDAQREVLAAVITAQQNEAQQGQAIHVDLQALELDEDSFSEIWRNAEDQSSDDPQHFASLLQSKLVNAGSPAGAISDLISQITDTPVGTA